MAADGLVPGVSIRVDEGPGREGVVHVGVGGEGGASLVVENDLAGRIYVVPEDS